jgi:predicted DNA-binding transcriptional regulator AlpA
MNAKNKDSKRLLLNCRSAAYTCGVDPKTWRNWHLRGLIPPPVYVGNSLFWRADELTRWVEASCPKRDEWGYK